MDRGAWWATFHGTTESDTTEQLFSKVIHVILYGLNFGMSSLHLPYTKEQCKNMGILNFFSSTMSYAYWNINKCWKVKAIFNIPGGSDGKASVYSVRDPGSIRGSGRYPGEGNGNPLQYYCLENPMDKGWLQSMGSQRARHDWATSLSLSLSEASTIICICTWGQGSNISEILLCNTGKTLMLAQVHIFHTKFGDIVWWQSSKYMTGKDRLKK